MDKIMNAFNFVQV